MPYTPPAPFSLRQSLRSSLLVCAVCLMFGAWASPSRAQVYSKLVVFGDSYSDTGNIYALSGGTNPSSPPYYQGRYSNGPIWIDDLTAMPALADSVTEDFALGGTLTDTTNNDSRFTGMQTEVASYLAAHFQEKNAG